MPIECEIFNMLDVFQSYEKLVKIYIGQKLIFSLQFLIFNQISIFNAGN